MYDIIQEHNFMIYLTRASLDKTEKGNESVKFFAIVSFYFLSVIRPFDLFWLSFHILRAVHRSLRPMDS
jgi:hypothetical protein